MLENVKLVTDEDGNQLYQAIVGGRVWVIPLEGHRWSVECSEHVK